MFSFDLNDSHLSIRIGVKARGSYSSVNKRYYCGKEILRILFNGNIPPYFFNPGKDFVPTCDPDRMEKILAWFVSSNLPDYNVFLKEITGKSLEELEKYIMTLQIAEALEDILWKRLRWISS